MTDIPQTIFEKQHVLLFDLDGTVFNTQQLKIDISQELQKYTQDTQILWETEKKLRDHRYHLVETMRQFCQHIGREDIQHIIQEIFLLKNFTSYVFPDVLEAFPILRSHCVNALFTQGDESYQQVKIYQSQLSPFFDFIYIYHSKMIHLGEIVDFFEKKQIWLIDNQINILGHAHEQFNQIKTIWMNREHLENRLHFSPDAIVDTCTQIVPLFV